MKRILDETKLGNLKMKNRIVRGALWEDLADEKGHLTPELEDIYEELAQGGVGTIITGYAFVTENEQPNPGMLGIYDDKFISEYKKFTDKIHSYDTNIILQICYGGFMTRHNVGERVIWGPSTAQDEVRGTWAQEMTKDEIKELVNAFGDAALRAKKSGFDGVEIHGAHGYILSQFLSPYFNKRTDEYGGGIDNRGRIILEVYQNIREKVGKDFSVWIKLNSADYVSEGGLTQEDSMYIAGKLSELGIDAIEVSGGNSSIKEVVTNNLSSARTKIVVSKENESYFKEYAIKLSNQIKTPVVLIGGNRHIDVMEDILNRSKIEYISMARPLTCEPNLVNLWKSGDLKKPKCVSCNKCFSTEGKRCILNIKK